MNADLITTLAARHKLPAVDFQRPFVAGSIRTGALPARAKNPPTFPVQAPTKYEMMINLKAAKTLESADDAAGSCRRGD